MSEVKARLALWPFIVVDVLFLGLAGILLAVCRHPLPWQEAGLIVVCGALGAWSFLTPFLRRSHDELAMSQFQLLSEATGKIGQLDDITNHINRATQQWQELQSHSTQTADSARQIFERMSAEAEAMTQFLQHVSDTERTHLRVEVDKLRRAENDRLQVITHMLDHIFALFQAARQSGQQALIDQIGQFQNACRDVVRRIGLVQMMAPAGEAFDAKLHQLPEDAAAPENARIEETIIPGYTYQGQIVRRAVVKLQSAA